MFNNVGNMGLPLLLLAFGEQALGPNHPDTAFSLNNLAALLHDLGFSWREAAGGFDHPSQTTILDAEGRVYRQIYGEDFPLQVFMAPLKELVLGRTTVSVAPADLWNRLTFLCTVYNPLTRAYRFDYGILFGIFFGAVSLLLTGLIIVRLWLEKRRAKRQVGLLRPARTADDMIR